MLLDLLCRQPPADLLEIRQKLGARSDFDLDLAKEYLGMLAKYGSLFVQKNIDLALAWTKIQPELLSSTTGAAFIEAEYSSGIETSRVVRLLKRAATIAATIGFIFLLTRAFFPNPYEVVNASQSMVYFLPEGTKVDMNAGSEIKFLRGESFTSAPKREVLVQGDLQFDVTSDPAHPFYVISDLTQVEVLGTIFKFKSNGSYSSTENIEGRVDYQVLGDTTHAVLNPGDKASYDGKKMSIKYYKPPAPTPSPPVPVPTHSISTLDLIDVLGHRYPSKLEFAPYLLLGGSTIQCNLDRPLFELLEELEKNQEVNINFRPMGHGRYIIYQLQGSSFQDTSNYSYFDFLEEIGE